MDHLAENVHEAVQHVVKNLTDKADVGVVLGSGLGSAARELEPEGELPYEQITYFPVSGVTGHEGKLLLCRLAGKTVLVLQGRFHYYEGYTMRGVTFPIRVLAGLGVGKVILTNAAGGLNRRYKPGDFMLVEDHINLMGDNPLIGVTDKALGPRFVDLKDAYDEDMLNLGAQVAGRLSMPAHRGVLAAMSGPSYETRAESRWLANAGADAVTMSTVPETIVARQSGMKVLAISCITNSVWQKDKTSHMSVVNVGNKASGLLARWLREFIREL
ncbi:MAG: purine-nucleoside phosphorylase [Actinomycetota bacterium]|nr:purine-nucleoside phosphorylase [Actinomycetota bacterium]